MNNSRKVGRLLVVSQYFYPEQFRINDMCKEWAKRGYKVTVLTGIPNYPQGHFYTGYSWLRRRNEYQEGIHIIRLPILPRGTSKLGLGLNYLSFVFSGFLWKCFTHLKADIVFSFEVSPMTQVLPAIWFANRRKIPCFAYIQDLWPENFVELTGISSPRIIESIAWMSMYIYQHCKMIFVTSESFRRVIANRGVAEDKIVNWPQYAEEYYQPSDTLSALVPLDGRLSIIFTGNIGITQGLDILPKTASLLRKKGLEARFILVGEGRGKPGLIKVIADEGVEDYFLFISQQLPQKIPAILACADVAFISFLDKPLFMMTIPAKLQSYMACGLPIIAAASGETKAIVDEAMCGFCSPQGDSAALGSVIERFLSLSSVERRNMGRRGLEYAKKRFNRGMLLDVMDSHFAKILGTDLPSCSGENGNSVTNTSSTHV